ncbi:MAG: hypothetical protein PHP37_00030 [Patescibacteria group bacterium]|nr:hypothetical protein [Patescibacteria group bacterium]
MSLNKKIKIIGLLFYVFLACFFVFYFKPIYILSISIVLVPPSVINFIWLKNSRIKVLLFSLTATLLFAPPIELMARIKDVWDVASVFPRPFGLIPLENMLFAFLNFFWALSFYEYFTDKDLPTKIDKKFRYLVALFVFFSLIIFSLYSYNNNLVGLNYFTLAFISLIIPSVIIFYKNPRLIKKTFLTTIFFAVVFFVYELISLKVGSWFWPGEYLFPTVIWGELFPLDDIIIWYFLSTPALIGGYEFFSDDFK